MAELQWIARPKGKRVASVIFIHGLQGHAYDTWRSVQSKDFWPVWLAQDIGGLEIATVSYRAAAVGWSGYSFSLNEYAKTFFEILRNVGGGDRETPLFFVCHSLGGLILKQLIEMAAGGISFGPEGKKFVRRVAGVIFYATPHGGSGVANLGSKLALFVWPSATISYLARNNAEVAQLNSDYRSVAQREKITHVSFYETMPTLFGTVVKQIDTDPGIAGTKLLPIEADHFGVCKPADRVDQRYAVTASFIASEIARFTGKAPRPVADGVLVTDPFPPLPKPPQVPLTALALRAAVALTVIYVAYRGIEVIYAENFGTQVEAIFKREGTPPELQRAIGDKLQELRDAGINDEALLNFLSDLQPGMNTNAAESLTRLNDFAARYEDLLSRIAELEKNGDQDITALASNAGQLAKSGDLDQAETFAGAAELARRLRRDVKFEARDGRVVFLDGWDNRNLVTATIPELAKVSGVGGVNTDTRVRFHRGAIGQLQAAFAEIEEAGLLDEINSWCAAFAPRTIRGSGGQLSDHALGLAFDINCSDFPYGKPFDAQKQSGFLKVVAIFKKHGFAWGGDARVPDPMHFQAFRLDADPPS